jgi:hypothetical protein
MGPAGAALQAPPPGEGNGRRARVEKIITKNKKKWKSQLTLRGAPDYIRLTNDGGDAAGDEEVRFWGSRKLDEIKRAA